MSDLQNYPNHTSFSERPKWKLIGPPPRWFTDDAEVLAEMDTDLLRAELRRRDDDAWNQTVRRAIASLYEVEKYKGQFAKNPGGGDFKGVKKER